MITVNEFLDAGGYFYATFAKDHAVVYACIKHHIKSTEKGLLLAINEHCMGKHEYDESIMSLTEAKEKAMLNLFKNYKENLLFAKEKNPEHKDIFDFLLTEDGV